MKFLKQILLILALIVFPLGTSAFIPLPTNQGGTGLDTIGSANQILGVNGTGTALEYKNPGGGDYTYVLGPAGYSMYAGQNISSLADIGATSTVTGSYTNPTNFNLFGMILMGNDAGANINSSIYGTVNDVAIGNGALYSDIAAGDNVAIGNGALYWLQSGGTNTAIGSSAGSGGAMPITDAQQSFFLGQQTGQNAQPFSYSSLGNVFIGAGAGVDTSASSITGSVVFGSQSFATDNFQFVLGGSSSSYNSITNGYFGSGVYVIPGFTPSDFTYHCSGADITATDQNGANCNFAGGIATGAGQGGGFTWQTSDAGGSGTTPQTLSNKMELATSGQLKLNRYGSGTWLSSPNYTLGVDASGNVIEFVGSGPQSLDQTLAVGNTTNGHDIIISNGDALQFNDVSATANVNIKVNPAAITGYDMYLPPESGTGAITNDGTGNTYFGTGEITQVLGTGTTTVTYLDSNKIFSNEGSGSDVTIELADPSSTANELQYSAVNNNNGIYIGFQPCGTCFILIDSGTLLDNTHQFRSNEPGSMAKLYKINSTTYAIRELTGKWSVL